MNVTAYMATFHARKSSFKKAVLSLCGQVDTLYVYVNGEKDEFYTGLPENVKVIFGDDLNSSGKYFLSDQWKGYVFTVDDDIEYPANYVRTCIEKVEKYERKAVISYHGRILEPPVVSFFRAKRRYYHFLIENRADVRVNHVGDGVMCLHTDCLKEPLSHELFKDHGFMSDIIFSIEMNKQHIPMYVCQHTRDWLKQLPVPWSLGSLQGKDDTKQTEVVNNAYYPVL